MASALNCIIGAAVCADGDWQHRNGNDYCYVGFADQSADDHPQWQGFDARSIDYHVEHKRLSLCHGGAFNLFDLPGLNHRCEINGGLEAEESLRLLQEFFRGRRAGNEEPTG